MSATAGGVDPATTADAATRLRRSAVLEHDVVEFEGIEFTSTKSADCFTHMMNKLHQ
jgi:hypothetical protein